MTIDLTVVPGLLLLALELLALAAIGYVAARVALGQDDRLLALAQGLAIGMALWGFLANFVLHAAPGRAGALLAWALLLSLALWLGWQRRRDLAIDRGTVAGFLAASLPVFAVALAARQTLIVSDAFIRFGLAAPIQAGMWPPILPWSPWQPIPYHYGADMLVGLLAPPVGPNLAFTKEVLDAAAWTSLAVLIGVTVRQRGGWLSLVVFTPLLLSAGAWIQLQGTSPALLQVRLPVGPPTPDLLDSLSSTYWPDVLWPPPYPEPHAAPANIWFLRFTLAYALALAVVERVADARQPVAWRTQLTLAALIGFLGLSQESLAAIVLGLWGAVQTIHLVRGRTHRARILARAAAGVGTAVVLLALGGGVLTGILAGTTGGNVAIALTANQSHFRPAALVDVLPGGLAALDLGPAILAGVAVLLAVRQRLVLALAAVATVFLLIALTLEYESAPQNIARLDAHAGNFALFALLVAASVRLRTARPRWRYPICAALVATVVWPSVALPLRTLALQVSHGIELANAQPGSVQRDIALYRAGIGRQTVEYLTPSQIVHYMPDPPPPLHTRPTGVLAHDQVIRYVQNRTPTDARIFSPHPNELTLATGRPNAAGFAGYLHYVERAGPDYQDAFRFLEPSAFRRLEYAYVHATDAWVDTLPDRAQDWLDDTRLFDLLVRDGQHALFRIRPAFAHLNAKPTPQSFEALRRTIPASATVHLTDGLQRLNKLRLATVLTHTRLTGTIDTSRIHLLPRIPIDQPDAHKPDVVIVARDLSLDLFEHGFPMVWWDASAIAYATSRSIAPTIDPPPRAAPDFVVRLSNVQSRANHVTFTAAFTDHAPQQWTGQDWLVVQLEDAPWAWPIHYEDDGYTLVGTQWFAGQIGPSGATEIRRYEFDAIAGTITIRSASGDRTPVVASADGLGPGNWALTVRLRQDYLQSAVIPVLRIAVSESGQVVYTAYSGERSSVLVPCPERMRQTDACRDLAARTAASAS